MKNRLFFIPVLVLCLFYFTMRMVMRVMGLDDSYIYYSREEDLQYFFDNIDLLLILIFLVCMYKVLRSPLFAKVFLTVGLVVLIPFSLITSIIYGIEDNVDQTFFINAENHSEDALYLLITHHYPNLHPEYGDPREVILFKKTSIPFTYKKLGSSKEVIPYDTTQTPVLNFTDNKRVTIEMEKERIDMEIQ